MVSIIIVTMGTDSYLLNCIKSIKDHIECEYEIIVVNNAKEPICLDEDVRTIENGVNVGFARAVNRGIEKSTGEMILLLNSDTLFEEDIISGMVSFMNETKNAGIAGVQLVFEDGRTQNSIDIIPTLANQFLNKALLKLIFRKSYPSKRSGFKKPVIVPSVIGACMMLSREMIDEIGMLDEGFFFYLEETDLCLRAAGAGYGVWHLPELRLIHYQGATAKKLNMERKIEFNRSMYMFFLKNRGVDQTLALFVLNVIKYSIETLTALPFAFVPSAKRSLKRSSGLLRWHLEGMPQERGLERTRPVYETRNKDGYTWFITGGTTPASPSAVMDQLDTIVNDSRTTFVKYGEYEGQKIYLKRYNYKGITDSIKNLFRKSRGRRSFEAAKMLENSGLDTPEVVFACERRVLGILVESYIATVALDAKDLVQCAREKTPDNDDIKKVASFIRRLHQRGILHVDLKGENLLVDREGRIHLIDLDRLKKRRVLPLAARAKNLSYLNASFAENISPEKRLSFINEYLKGRPDINKGELIRQTRELTVSRLEKRYN